MKDLRKLVLAAAIAAPFALYAQPIEKPAQQNAKAEASTTADGNNQAKTHKNAWRTFKHGMNPVTWVHYLSQREYCTYAFSKLTVTAKAAAAADSARA